jgi:hypothetical protein
MKPAPGTTDSGCPLGEESVPEFRRVLARQLRHADHRGQARPVEAALTLSALPTAGGSECAEYRRIGDGRAPQGR